MKEFLKMFLGAGRAVYNAPNNKPFEAAELKNVEKMIKKCHEHFYNCIIEGTSRGNNYIKQNFMPNKDMDPETNNWCGYFAQSIAAHGGYDINIASYGKLVYGFGQYNTYNGKKAFASYPEHIEVKKGKIISIKEYHEAKGLPRMVGTDMTLVEPMDFIGHKNPDSPYNGHVMVCVAVSKELGYIFTIEGNRKGTLPTLKTGTGVVMRAYKVDDPYLTTWVKMSPLDYNAKFVLK